MASESDPSCVFFVASVVIPNPVHHLDKDVLAVHQLSVIPFSSIIKILFHQVSIGGNVGNLQVEVVFQILQAFHLIADILFHAGLQVISSFFQGKCQSPIDFVNFFYNLIRITFQKWARLGVLASRM